MQAKRSHIADILRQGVWASMTGGWYFEPGNSMFCNTVHLYTWLILLISPLLLGVSSGGEFDWTYLALYAGMIFLLFVVLKLTILYLHRVFDTNEPIIKQKVKERRSIERCQSPLSSLSVRATESNAIEMVDLNELRRGGRALNTEEDDTGNSDGGGKHVRISRANLTSSDSDDDDDDDDDDGGGGDGDEGSRRKRRREKRARSSASSSSGKNSTNELLSIERGVKRRGQTPSSTPSGILLPADSLELLPISSGRYRRPSSIGVWRNEGGRKLSDPNVEGASLPIRKFNIRRRKSEERPFVTSRRSSQSGGSFRGRSLLVQHAVSHRSSSGGSSRKGRNLLKPAGGVYVDEFAMRKADSIDNWLAKCAPPINSTSAKQGQLSRQGTDTKASRAKESKESQGGPSTSSAVGRTANSPPPSIDVKMQITKFLEQLIERHPETLEAIENIRVSRLRGGRGSGGGGVGSYKLHPTEPGAAPADELEGRERLPTAVYRSRTDNSRELLNVLDSMQLCGLSGSSERHIAQDQEDCSQGATHCYQDENGTWWTYSFDEQGSGTAQALGSNLMISEMLMRRASDDSGAPAIMKETRGEATHSTTLPTERRPSATALRSKRLGLKKESTSTGPVEKGHEEEEASTSKLGESVEKAGHHAAAAEGGGSELRTEVKELPIGDRTSSDEEVDRYISDRPTRIIGPISQAGASTLNTASYSISGLSASNARRQEPRFGHRRHQSDFSGSSGGGQQRQLFNFINIASNFVPRLYNQAGGNRPIPSLLSIVGANAAHASQHPGVASRASQTSDGGGGRLAASLQHANERRQRLHLYGVQSRDSARSILIRQPNAESLMRIDAGAQDGVVSTADAGGVGYAGTPRPTRNAMRIFAELHASGGIGRRDEVLARAIPPTVTKTKLNYYYKLNVVPSWLGASREIMLKLDRLSMAALFDSNRHIGSVAFDILLAVLVAILGATLIFRGLYSDISLVAFCLVMAGAQFSLLKSVQPDPTSPIHGFNCMTTYSRPLYFCTLALIVLLLDVGAIPALFGADMERSRYCTYARQGADVCENLRPPWLNLYVDYAYHFSAKSFLANAILLLPLAFTMGLVPQMNTMAMHLMEQVDMHLFGATASVSLLSALLSLIRSVIACAILTAQGVLALHLDSRNDFHGGLAFSLYVAELISLAYMLSRWPSNSLFLRLLCRRNPPKMGENAKIDDESNEASMSFAGRIAKQFSRCGCLPEGKASRTQTGAVGEEQNESSDKSPNVASPRQRNASAARRGVPQATSGQRGSSVEPLEDLLRKTLVTRLQHDLLYALVNTLIIFGLVYALSLAHAVETYAKLAIYVLCLIVGSTNHFIYPQMRSRTPWKMFARPLLRAHEYHQFETTQQAKLTRFEVVHVWMVTVEKNILHPLLTVLLTMDHFSSWPPVTQNRSLSRWTVAVATACSFRVARTGYSQPQLLCVPLAVTCALDLLLLSSGHRTAENADWKVTPLIALYLLLAAWPKLIEFLLKLNFILIYSAPWQISWGSAFHAFMQPFSIPHTGLTLMQTLLSTLFSAPLNPFLGSSFFLTSYMRPVKFWERDYNTKRVDHSKQRLIAQLDRLPVMDTSNLNGIFYEHLTRSLQKSLAGDILLGRWATSLQQGDCFILASLYLNCLIHVVEVGNGFVTFQLRGLEFAGTYCHQREVEAISEDYTRTGCACCCLSGIKLPCLLPFSTAWSLRWLTWEVVTSKYVIDGYSITDNSAVNLLQVHELRRLLVTLYVKCMIYYAVNSPDFEKWISNDAVLEIIDSSSSRQNGYQKSAGYGRTTGVVEMDPVFCAANDEDFDLNLGGISKQAFLSFYGDWIRFCLANKKMYGTESGLFTNFELVSHFSFLLSILGRRSLAAASFNRHANAAESFLFGLHALFRGDMRVTASADEWVLSDPEILSDVVSPAVKMALKLHQEHFIAADDFEEPACLFGKLMEYEGKIYISHEHDPGWREHIIGNTPSLLALRHVFDDGQDDYKIIMLNRMHLNMRVIKLNRECVRAFWAGQQQEQIFLRNRNPERGSIQNARSVLRNMINSSADQPIGYPIYVSPLTTSFVETHSQISDVTGRPVTIASIWTWLCRLLAALRHHFGFSGSSQCRGNNENMPLPSVLASYDRSREPERVALCTRHATSRHVSPTTSDTKYKEKATTRDGDENMEEKHKPSDILGEADNERTDRQLPAPVQAKLTKSCCSLMTDANSREGRSASI